MLKRVATLFFLTSLALAYLIDVKGGIGSDDIMDTEVPVVEQVMPDIPQLDGTTLSVPGSDIPVAPSAADPKSETQNQ